MVSLGIIPWFWHVKPQQLLLLLRNTNWNLKATTNEYFSYDSQANKRGSCDYYRILFPSKPTLQTLPVVLSTISATKQNVKVLRLSDGHTLTPKYHLLSLLWLPLIYSMNGRSLTLKCTYAPVSSLTVNIAVWCRTWRYCKATIQGDAMHQATSRKV